MHDLLVIGAGPVGLACAIEAKREGLTAVVIDKGTLVNSIVGYPTNMEFFSTPELIEIGRYPFPIPHYKPTREDAIEYYRTVVAREQLDVRLYETVVDVRGQRGDFTVTSSKGEHRCRHIVLSTGFFDRPNRLGVPGEDLPKVTHYYKEPYGYVGQKVAVVGARNSAAKAALDCYRHGANVTMIVRAPELSEKIKYWIKPDLENRIKEGSIRVYFNTTIEAITPTALRLETPDGSQEIGNDWVLAMTGYHPDYPLLERFGITFQDDRFRTPIYDDTTFETARRGVYLAGTVCGGYQTGRWFIENGRFHASQIAKHIARGNADPVHLENRHWKTEE
jgi:thioredoxin reductase (NADPH)